MKRKMYYAVVEFLAPAGNILQILANDEDHARELLAKMHTGVKDFKILDIHDMDNNPELKQLIEMQGKVVSEDNEGGSTPVVLN